MGVVRIAAASLLLIGAGAEAQIPKKVEAPGKFLVSAEIQGSMYRQENLDWNEMKGSKAGLAGRVGYLGATGNYVALDVRLATGKVDIDTGNSKGSKSDRLSDIRLLAGRRFSSDGGSLTPYLGMGRLLTVNKTGGLQTTGPGIPIDRRTGSLRYAAIGVDWAIGTPEAPRFELNAEFDHLLRGQQSTDLLGISQTNVQNYGSGVRGSVLFGFGSWAVGPFASHWKVKASNSDDFWIEPETKTTEAGVRVRYTFR